MPLPISAALESARSILSGYMVSTQSEDWMVTSLPQEWLRENLTGVGIEVGRIAEGQWGDRFSLTLYLAEKPWFGETALRMLLPGGLPGIELAIKLSGRFRPLSGGPLGEKRRPATAGLSIGPDFQDTDTSFQRGTLGALVRRNAAPATWHVLSNNHVIALNGDVLGTSSGSSPINQPAAADDSNHGAANRIGVVDQLDDFCRLRGMPAKNVGDFALARVLDKSLVSPAPQPDMPAIRSRSPLAPEGLEKTRVLKFGRTTGKTKGSITGFKHDFPLAYAAMGNAVFFFHDQIMVEAEPAGTVFATDGDSGSLVMTEAGDAIGLVFAAGGTGGTVVCPLKPLFDRLQLSFVLPGDS